jgi:hypothetical protein
MDKEPKEVPKKEDTEKPVLEPLESPEPTD